MPLFRNFEQPLKSNIGNNRTNDPDDIVKTKRHLNKLGYFDEDTEVPFITKEMENGIIKYQKDKKLKIDGVMKPGGETERSIFEELTLTPAEALWDYKEDDSISIGFGGDITGTLPSRKTPKIREGIIAQVPDLYNKPAPLPTQSEQLIGSIDTIADAINTAKGNTKRSRENRGVFKTAEILARVHEEAKRRKEQNMMSISAEKSFTLDGTEDSAIAKPAPRPEATSTQDRKDAIINNKGKVIKVVKNSDANPKRPIYAWPIMSEVNENNDKIESEARKADLDPDLVKAIVHLETTQGYYDRIKPDKKTIRPMNVHVEYWKDLGYSREDLNDKNKNIEAGVELLKRIKEKMPNASTAEIASVYHSLGAQKVSDYGARVEILVKEKPWENNEKK